MSYHDDNPKYETGSTYDRVTFQLDQLVSSPLRTDDGALLLTDELHILGGVEEVLFDHDPRNGTYNVTVRRVEDHARVTSEQYVAQPNGLHKIVTSHELEALEQDAVAAYVELLSKWLVLLDELEENFTDLENEKRMILLLMREFDGIDALNPYVNDLRSQNGLDFMQRQYVRQQKEQMGAFMKRMYDHFDSLELDDVHYRTYEKVVRNLIAKYKLRELAVKQSIGRPQGFIQHDESEAERYEELGSLLDKVNEY